MRLLVTGATGFVGTAVMRRIQASGRIEACAAVRNDSTRLPDAIEKIVVGHLSSETDWTRALDGVNGVLHLAARVHVMRDTAPDSASEFHRVNVAATINLANQAARIGVRRFVFLSSVKVNGNSGIFSESDPVEPRDRYGVSKFEAEIGLRRIAAESGMEVVVIRPPLVYGPGVRANFRFLMRAVSSGIPLPFGAVYNRRSLVGLDNLVDFIHVCVDRPAAANETFFVSDGEDLSTTDLIRRMAAAIGREARLIPIPSKVLMAAAVAVGRRDMAERLLGTLRVDISKAQRLLHWTPPISVDEGLRRAAKTL